MRKEFTREMAVDASVRCAPFGVYFDPDDFAETESIDRVWLALKVKDEIVRRKKEASLKKQVWIRNSRKSFFPGEQKPCSYCCMHKCISHAHHVVPLSQQYDSHQGTKLADHGFVWLCPNHHALIHLVIDFHNTGMRTQGDRFDRGFSDLSKDSGDLTPFFEFCASLEK